MLIYLPENCTPKTTKLFILLYKTLLMLTYNSLLNILDKRLNMLMLSKSYIRAVLLKDG